ASSLSAKAQGEWCGALRFAPRPRALVRSSWPRQWLRRDARMRLNSSVGWLSNIPRRIIGAEVTHLNYKVVIHESEEGFSVSCPGLPGCWSQGQTEAEALENIKDAIREYLAAVDDLVRGQDVREVKVAV